MIARGPLVSVLVPAYNVEKHLGACLDCLTGQSYERFEVIVVDDCSTDQTWRVIEEYAEYDSRIIPLRNTTNLMAPATRNRAFEAASGEFIMLQDADDLCEPDRMRRLLSHLSESSTDFVSSGHYLFDAAGVYRRVVPRVAEPGKVSLLYGSPFCHAATMFRRECLSAVGAYRESPETERGQDYDLFIRLYARGFRGSNLPDVLYGYRVDAETIARRTFAYRIDECRIRWKGFGELGLMPWAAPFVLKPLLAHAFQRTLRR